MTRAAGLGAAAALGALWGGMGAPLWGIAAILTGGVDAVLPLGHGALAGAAAGLIAGMLARRGHDGLRLVATSAGVFFAGFFLLSLGTPFGLDPGAQPFWGLVGALALAMTVGMSLRANLDGIDLRELRRYGAETLLLRALRGAGFVVFTSLVVLPFYAMVITSLKTQAVLLADPLDFAIDLGRDIGELFDGYIVVLTTFRFGRYVGVSTLVSISTVLITLIFAIPGAYAVARLRFPGRAALSRSILLIYMVPAIVLVIPLYGVFSQLGLRDSLLGLLIVYPATTIPVALYMLQGYFRSIPAELEEAALIDGCSRGGVIWRVTLPLSLPVLATVALYVFMIAWNEFLFAFMFLDDPDIFTLSRAIVSLNSSEVPRQYLMAGAVIVTVPVLILFLWFERYLVQGLTAGSVKG